MGNAAAEMVAVESTDALVDAVVADTDADRRSVIRRLAGLPVRGAAGLAIDRALAARGLRR